MLSVSAHAEGGPTVEQLDNVEVLQAAPTQESDAFAKISETMQKQSISSESQGSAQGKQQRRCKKFEVLGDDKMKEICSLSSWKKWNQ